MKIPRQLPQSEHDSACIIAAGKQDAVIYKAARGTIDEAGKINIPKPRYSDREGHFKTRSGGKVLRSGAVRERDDEKIIADFLRQLKPVITSIAADAARIYLFAPAKTKRRIATLFSRSDQKKIKMIYPGNYYSRHPLFFLKKIASS
jgi:hypothetical protein